MPVVESRFLQVLVSAVTGDRVTIGLMHWDGVLLRSMLNLSSVPLLLKSERKQLGQEARAQLKRATRAAREAAPNGQRTILGLGHVLERVDFGSERLRWTSSQMSQVDEPLVHFHGVCESLGFGKRRGVSEESRIRALRKELGVLGEEMERQGQGAVQTEHVVSFRHALRSPISWKNGRWHHVVVANFDRKLARSISEEAEQVLGRVRLSIPLEDRGVVVVLMPSDETLRACAESEVAALAEQLPSVVFVPCGPNDRASAIDSIRARIRGED
jgi:hypothetical protein